MDVRNRGLVLFLLGLAGILWGTFHFLGEAYGPEGIGTTFAERPRYDEVKANIHAHFLGSFLRGMAGLALSVVGWRMMERAGDSPERPAS